MNDKFKKVLADPKEFVIDDVTVKISPLDFEDTMRLMSLKRDSSGSVDTSDKDSLDSIKKVMEKKLRQSLTVVKENGERDVPTDEDIKSVSMSFYTEYMKKLFSMVKDVEGETKKK